MFSASARKYEKKVPLLAESDSDEEIWVRFYSLGVGVLLF